MISMATINDYTSGKILKDVKLINYSLKLARIPILGSWIKNKIFDKTKNFKPLLINIEDASKLINGSEHCAVGERVCRAINKDSKPTKTMFLWPQNRRFCQLTESVFLDELAEGMVKTQKARYVGKEEAINTLKKYPENPLILAKVSNKYMEICRSYPKDCVFYNMQRHKIKCLTKFK